MKQTPARSPMIPTLSPKNFGFSVTSSPASAFIKRTFFSNPAYDLKLDNFVNGWTQVHIDPKNDNFNSEIIIGQGQYLFTWSVDEIEFQATT